jgi:hypothetical protein
MLLPSIFTYKKHKIHSSRNTLYKRLEDNLAENLQENVQS